MAFRYLKELPACDMHIILLQFFVAFTENVYEQLITVV